MEDWKNWFERKIDRSIFCLVRMTRWKVWESLILVANSFAQSRRTESSLLEPQYIRREGEREKSSFSPSPSQSGVSDSRSAASTPTVGTLTLQILIRQLGETRLLTLHASAYLNFSNECREHFLASYSPWVFTSTRITTFSSYQKRFDTYDFVQFISALLNRVPIAYLRTSNLPRKTTLDANVLNRSNVHTLLRVYIRS